MKSTGWQGCQDLFRSDLEVRKDGIDYCVNGLWLQSLAWVRRKTNNLFLTICTCYCLEITCYISRDNIACCNFSSGDMGRPSPQASSQDVIRTRCYVFAWPGTQTRSDKHGTGSLLNSCKRQEQRKSRHISSKEPGPK